MAESARGTRLLQQNNLRFSARGGGPFLSAVSSPNFTRTMLSFLSLATLALVAPAFAQSGLELVDAQYVASGFASRTYANQIEALQGLADCLDAATLDSGSLSTPPRSSPFRMLEDSPSSTALRTLLLVSLIIPSPKFTSASRNCENGVLNPGCQLSRGRQSAHLCSATHVDRYERYLHVHPRRRGVARRPGPRGKLSSLPR